MHLIMKQKHLIEENEKWFILSTFDQIYEYQIYLLISHESQTTWALPQ